MHWLRVHSQSGQQKGLSGFTWIAWTFHFQSVNESLLVFKIIALVPFHPHFPIDTARRAALLVCFLTVFTMGRVLLSIFSCLLVLSVDVLCFCCKLLLPQKLIMMLIHESYVSVSFAIYFICCTVASLTLEISVIPLAERFFSWRDLLLHRSMTIYMWNTTKIARNSTKCMSRVD